MKNWSNFLRLPRGFRRPSEACTVEPPPPISGLGTCGCQAHDWRTLEGLQDTTESHVWFMLATVASGGILSRWEAILQNTSLCCRTLPRCNQKSLAQTNFQEITSNLWRARCTPHINYCSQQYLHPTDFIIHRLQYLQGVLEQISCES